MAAPSVAPSSQVWLYRPSIDLLFGYGLIYLISVPVLGLLALQTGIASVPLWLGGCFLLMITLPHYGATILRVYEQRHDRQKYALFAVWATAFLLAWFVGGLYWPLLGSLLMTISVTWNPWHLSGQNFGLAVMYMRRRGLDVPPEIKKPLYVSFILSAALAITWIHMPNENLPYGTTFGAADGTGTFGVIPLGFPTGFADILSKGLMAAYLGCLAVVAVRLREKLTFVQQVPIWMLVASQALWFSVPAFGAASGLYDLTTVGLPFLAFWIAAAHGAQYLWVTCYYARRTGGGTAPVPFIAKALLAGAVLTLPGLLFAPNVLGGVAPYSIGAVVLTFSLINVHHCMLDGAIWKLRDGRIARILVRNAESAPETPAPGRRWLRSAVLAVGAVLFLLQVQLLWVSRAVSQPDVSLPTLRAATAELTWLGRDTPELWAKLGHDLEKAGEISEAVAAFRHAIEMNPRPRPWVASHLAWLLLAGENVGQAEVAEVMRLSAYLTRSLGPARSEGYETLAAAHLAAGRSEKAAAAAAKALAISREHEEPQKTAALQRRLVERGTLTAPN